MSKQLFALLGLAGLSVAALTDIIIPQEPDGLILSEGNAKDNNLFGPTGFSGQNLVMENALVVGGKGLHAGQVIKSFIIRTDSEVFENKPYEDLHFDDFRVGFSTNNFGKVDDLTTNFANNRGDDFVWALSGEFILDAFYFPGDKLTLLANPFPANYIPLDRPWGYSGGNLIIDLTHSGYTNSNQSLAMEIDFHGAPDIYKVMVNTVYDATDGGFAASPYQSIIMGFEVYDSPGWDCPTGAGDLYCFETDAQCQNNANADIVSLANGALFSDAVNCVLLQILILNVLNVDLLENVLLC